MVSRPAILCSTFAEPISTKLELAEAVKAMQNSSNVEVEVTTPERSSRDQSAALLLRCTVVSSLSAGAIDRGGWQTRSQVTHKKT